MPSEIKGTDFNDNNTVNGNDRFHASLVGGDLTNDIIYGYKGDDELFGRGGNDELNGGFGKDYLYGEAGNDKLDGQGGDDFLYGGAGKDTLFGNSQNDYLFGGNGKDSLFGGPGNDYLDGANFSGAGNGIASGGEFDTLTGGAGADTFVLGNVNNVYYLGTGHATMIDFSLAQQDKIQIKGNLTDGYSLQAGDWNNNNVQDTGIFHNGNLIGVVRDNNLINVNPNQVFLSAPPIPI
ncbi:MAG: calcium-binding protein [Microcoleus sp.]